MILIKGIPFKKIQGITLFPFIIVKPKMPSMVLLNHERIHIRQQLELLIIPFYIWYLSEWLYHFSKCRHTWIAYRRISFEREAYDNETDFTYLKNRKIWGFWKYMK
ncbi:hypothetical protein [Emticicia sp. SJ17W-69]|uniref:hypothetical protein n=1 Tax=Emticicia sp. SJ17W-69 TaxID=3421657 RepID=UPI003EBB98CA